MVYIEDNRAEMLAEAFHEAYERLAPKYGYNTRQESAVPWSDVPEGNKNLMVDVAHEMLTFIRKNELLEKETK